MGGGGRNGSKEEIIGEKTEENELFCLPHSISSIFSLPFTGKQEFCSLQDISSQTKICELWLLSCSPSLPSFPPLLPIPPSSTSHSHPPSLPSLFPPSPFSLPFFSFPTLSLLSLTPSPSPPPPLSLPSLFPYHLFLPTPPFPPPN